MEIKTHVMLFVKSTTLDHRYYHQIFVILLFLESPDIWSCKHCTMHHVSQSLLLILFSLQSRGSSPLSPFLDQLGSPPPAHMGALRPGSLYPLPPQYGAYTSLGMEQLAAWHQASIYQQGVRAASPYSLPSSLTPPISR